MVRVVVLPAVSFTANTARSTSVISSKPCASVLAARSLSVTATSRCDQAEVRSCATSSSITVSAPSGTMPARSLSSGAVRAAALALAGVAGAGAVKSSVAHPASSANDAI